MFPVRYLSLIPLLVVVPVTLAQVPKDTKEEVLTKPLEDTRDLTNLKRINERAFVHVPTGVAYTIPEGWKEIRPHRLDRKIDKRINTVLGIEHGPRDHVASLYWIQMNPSQKLSDWVRDTAAPISGEYGEEYETLKAVYGKDRVTVPVKMKHGPFEVYRIYINGGPERGEKYDGTLFVFEFERGGTHWLLKARVSFPKGERSVNDQFATEVLQGYTLMPDKAGPEPKKTIDLDDLGPLKLDSEKK